VRRKLYDWKLRKDTVETLLAALIEERLVNESHYAASYAGERFRINGWGKNKVRVELKKRQISPYCIREALAAVDPVQYEKELRRLADKKWASFQGKGLHPSRRAKKVADFLIRKGYEPGTVWNVVRELKNPETPGDDH
jgi:regulatory protein